MLRVRPVLLVLAVLIVVASARRSALQVLPENVKGIGNEDGDAGARAAPAPVPRQGFSSLPMYYGVHEASPAPDASQYAGRASGSVSDGNVTVDWHDGITQIGGAIPPDGAIAVGPNHVLTLANTVGNIYDKNFAAVVAPVTLAEFHDADGIGGTDGIVFDPRAVYDYRTDRYIALSVRGLGGIAYNSWFEVATSQTDDILTMTSTDWYYTTIVATDSQFLWADYPHLCIGENHVFVTVNMFTAGANLFQYSSVMAIDKPNLLADTLTGSHLSRYNMGDTSVFTISPGQVPTIGSSGLIHAIAAVGIGSTFRTLTFTDPAGSAPDVVLQGSSMSAGIAYTLPERANQPGYPLSVPTNDPRISAPPVQWRDRMYISINTKYGDANATVAWFEYDMSTRTLTASGILGDENEQYYFGGIAVDPDGNLGLVATHSSSTELPGVAMFYRSIADPDNTMHGPIIAKRSTVAWQEDRWGDYVQGVVASTLESDGWHLWFQSMLGTSASNWRMLVTKMNIGQMFTCDPACSASETCISGYCHDNSNLPDVLSAIKRAAPGSGGSGGDDDDDDDDDDTGDNTDNNKTPGLFGGLLQGPLLYVAMGVAGVVVIGLIMISASALRGSSERRDQSRLEAASEYSKPAYTTPKAQPAPAATPAYAAAPVPSRSPTAGPRAGNRRGGARGGGPSRSPNRRANGRGPSRSPGRRAGGSHGSRRGGSHGSRRGGSHGSRRGGR